MTCPSGRIATAPPRFARCAARGPHPYRGYGWSLRTLSSRGLGTISACCKKVDFWPFLAFLVKKYFFGSKNFFHKKSIFDHFWHFGEKKFFLVKKKFSSKSRFSSIFRVLVENVKIFENFQKITKNWKNEIFGHFWPFWLFLSYLSKFTKIMDFLIPFCST